MEWRRLPVYKPNFVHPGRRRRAATGAIIIYLGSGLRRTSSGLPTSSGGQPSVRRLHGLAPREVCLAVPVAGNAGGLLPHHFTHHLCSDESKPSAGMLSVARAVSDESEPPVLSGHGALWCSDFPPRNECEAMIRPASLFCNEVLKEKVLGRKNRPSSRTSFRQLLRGRERRPL